MSDFTLYLKVKLGAFFFFASLFDTIDIEFFRLRWVQPSHKIIHCNGFFGAVTGFDINAGKEQLAFLITYPEMAYRSSRDGKDF